MDYVSSVCCLVAFLLYYNTLDAGFVYDDRRAILTNPDLLPKTPWSHLFRNDFWGTPLTDSGSHGSYRPLCVLTFRLNYLLGGFQPWGYHLVNVLLHCLATALLVKLARKVLPATKSAVGPALSGLLFATHPVHTEAVAGVVGRADLAACNFYLLAFLSYISHVRYRDTACCHRSFVTWKTEQESGGTRHHQQNPPRTLKYQKFVYNSLQKNVTSCNWPKRLGVVVVPDNDADDNILLRGEVCNNSRGGGGGGGGMLWGWSCWFEKSWSSTVGCCCWKSELLQWTYLGLCVTFAVAAMLSKETGVTVLGVCIIYDFVYCSGAKKQKQWRSLVVLGAALSALLALRLQQQSNKIPEFSTADNPTAKERRLLSRLLTFLYLPVFNMGLLLMPTSLSFDWGMDAVPRIHSLWDFRNFYSFTCYFLSGFLIKRAVLGVQKLKLRKNSVQYERMQHKQHQLDSIVKLQQQEQDNQRLKQLSSSCSCTVCHSGLTNEVHSVSCRNSNNNNSMNGHSTCVCPFLRLQLRLAGRKRMTTSAHPTSTVWASNQKSTNSCCMAILLSMALLALPFLPATNLLFYVGFVVAERVLYLPSAGLCLMMGMGGAVLYRQKWCRAFVVFGFVVVLVAFTAKTLLRNKDWMSEEALYRSAIHVNPPKAYGNLGSVLSSQGRSAEAEWAFKKALHYRPNMADVHYNLGILLQSQPQRLDEAIESYQRAIHFRPSLALAYVNLGAALISAGRCQEAVSVLRQGSRLDGTGLRDRREHESAKVSALLQLGALYSDQGRLQRALAAYREAAYSLPEHYPPQGVFNVLGETLARLHQDEEAERWYQAALNAQPDHVPAHITYGKLLAKNVSRTAEAEQWFRKAQRLAPEEPSVYHHYGEFLASRRRYNEAASMYEKAAELRPQDYELVVAAATAMRQAARQQDAEEWYRRAVALKPKDARSHTNLGAILHLNGKYKEAAHSYREALKLQPDDVTTLTNLHKLHSVMTT